MSEASDMIALIDQRIRANLRMTTSWGTVQTRDTDGPGAYVIFDGSTLGVPVKVPGTVICQASDRVILNLVGTEWIVTNSFSAIESGRGKVASDSLTSSGSSTSGTTELVVMTASSFAYQAGRAYKAEFAGSYDVTVAPNNIVMRVRKTNISGQQISVARVHAPNAATSFDGGWHTYFTVSNDDVAAVMVLTMVGGAGFSGKISAAATSPAFFTISDVDMASQYPDAAVLI